jgi:hypothetical protein
MIALVKIQSVWFLQAKWFSLLPMDVVKGFVSYIDFTCFEVQFYLFRFDNITMPNVNETPLLRLQFPSLFK